MHSYNEPPAGPPSTHMYVNNTTHTHLPLSVPPALRQHAPDGPGRKCAAECFRQRVDRRLRARRGPLVLVLVSLLAHGLIECLLLLLRLSLHSEPAAADGITAARAQRHGSSAAASLLHLASCYRRACAYESIDWVGQHAATPSNVKPMGGVRWRVRLLVRLVGWDGWKW